MSDLISRQAVIEMLDETKRIARQNIDGTFLMTFERVFDSLVNITNALPTIQPKTRKGNCMDNNEHGTNLAEVGTDCISRQQAIDAVEFGITYARAFNKETGEVKELFKESNDELRKAVERIRQLPPIQPEIVRCKDCKHWIPYDWMFSEVWRSKNMADYPEDEIGCNLCDMAMKADDYCSRADMREVNHESN